MIMHESTGDSVATAIPALDCSKIIAVKYGGAAMSDEYSEEMFAADIATLCREGIHPVIIHGGGGHVTDIAARLGIATTFVNGHRVTDDAMMEAVVMGLAGLVNKNVVRMLRSAGVNAIGLSGVDGGLLRATKMKMGDNDLGMVGEVMEVNAELLHGLIEMEMVPVIAPIGIGGDGTLYNINADPAAGAVASALAAEELLYLSNVPGIIVDGELLPRITEPEARALIDRGIIHGGMLPKLFSAFHALNAGVKKVKIVDAPGGEGTTVVGGLTVYD